MCFLPTPILFRNVGIDYGVGKAEGLIQESTAPSNADVKEFEFKFYQIMSLHAFFGGRAHCYCLVLPYVPSAFFCEILLCSLAILESAC